MNTEMINKKDAVNFFRELWADAVTDNESLKGDSIAKHEAFYAYVDGLVKDGQARPRAMDWTYPFSRSWENNRA